MALGVKLFQFRAILALAVVLGMQPFVSADDPAPKPFQELEAILADWEGAQTAYSELLQQAKARAEKDKVRATKAPSPVPFAERCLRVAEKHPGTSAELKALWWAFSHAPSADAGRKAYDKLAKGRLESADLSELAAAIEAGGEAADTTKALDLAAIVLDRLQRGPDHARGGWLLNWMCVLAFDARDQPDPPKVFREAADLIAARYASSPDITNFCECLGMGSGSPAWAGKYEKHLRKILKENRNRRARGGAAFALASVVHFAGGVDRQREAEKLYQQYLHDFDGSDPINGSVEQVLREAARAACEEVRWRAVGKVVPEIEGKDLDGRPLKLSDHRGNVVLLSFWGTWCFPCMKLLPHEQALAERLRNKPFVLLGVNCDTNAEALQRALVKHKITWRSFQNKRADGTTIASAWHVIGFPTLYLINHKGIIRKRWVGAPTAEELNRAVDEEIARAMR
jgi:thiol-disulfide isomerase/thioredoxin